jgi:carboxymethylenebutenolidase
MNGKTIELRDATGNPYRTYLSEPVGGRGPGVVIGLDIFGLRPLYHDIADLFAEQGYLAAVPDYFWDVEMGEAGSYRGKYRFSTMIEVTRATIEQLRTMPACNGKVAATGFCVGGNTAFIAATQRADAAASYYGTRLHTLLDEVGNIKCPILLHIAEHDETYPDDERDKILVAIQQNPRITPYVYTAPHGFASSHVVPEAQTLAHQRTFTLFETLK